MVVGRDRIRHRIEPSFLTEEPEESRMPTAAKQTLACPLQDLPKKYCMQTVAQKTA
jgi:hypothetical protein